VVSPRMASALFDWQRYRALMDALEGSRRAGLLDPKAARAAVADSRSVVLVTEDETIVPVAVPVAHVVGWDAARCGSLAAELAGSRVEPLWLSRLPTRLLHAARAALADRARADGEWGRVVLAELPDGKARRGDEEVLAGTLWREQPLGDPATGPPSISLWATHAVPTDQRIASTCPEEWAESVAGVVVYSGEDTVIELRVGVDCEEVIAELWALYTERFGWLGEAHPISMEDTRSSFEELLVHPATVVVLSKDGNGVACWSFLTADGVDRCRWLHEPSIRACLTSIDDEDAVLTFFPGIVARADRIGHHAAPTLKALAEAAGQVGVPLTVLYEATNRSEAYVPRLVYEHANSARSITVAPSVCLEHTIYTSWVGVHDQ